MNERDVELIVAVMRTHKIENSDPTCGDDFKKLAERMGNMLHKEVENFNMTDFLISCGVGFHDQTPSKEYASPYFNDEDQEVWEGRKTITIGSYTVKPKKDFGRYGYYDAKTRQNLKAGFIVTNGVYNALPGAVWAKTVDEAIQSIHILGAVGEAGFHWLSAALRMQSDISAREKKAR
jgi:hypothetical protein